MGDQIEATDAAHALSEIGRRREQVLRRVVIPGWFWWAVAVLMIVLTAAAESRRGVVLGLGIAFFVAGLLVTIGRVVFRAVGDAPPRRGLVGAEFVPRLLVGVAVFVVVVVGVALATGFSLKAAGVSYPATITVAVTAVLLVVGGPMLMRYETAVLVRRPATQG